MKSVTIITPTVQRESLIKTCDSVSSQSFFQWQHIVMVDCAPNLRLLDSLAHSQRRIVVCNAPHRNAGNTCRHIAWELATGEYIYYLDDDNFLADNRVLEDLQIVTTPWALFPILRGGVRFFHDPPKICYVDTGNVIARRDIGRWPDIPDYTADGYFVEGLKKHAYQAFPEFRPIMVMPQSNFARAE